MSYELFDDVVARPQSLRSRRSPLVIASLAIHGALVAGLVVASVVAPAALPFPQHSLCYCADIQLVTLPRSPVFSDTITSAEKPSGSRSTVDPPTPPVQAPSGAPGETGGKARLGDGTIASGDAIASEPLANPPVVGTGIPTDIDAAPPSQAPIRLHSGIRPPRKVIDVAPVYPALAQQMRVAGVVILEATIDAAGVVQSARVLRSVPLLDHAAIDAVRLWRFEPARLNDQPVAVIMTVTVNFTLGR